MIKVPAEIIEKLMEYSKENGLGLAAVGGNGFYLIIIGDRTHHINKIALLCAQALIGGVLDDSWNTDNEVKIISREPERTQ